MNTSALVLLAAALMGQTSRMDHSIGGKSVDQYHESVYDARQKLYLYSGGD